MSQHDLSTDDSDSDHATDDFAANQDAPSGESSTHDRSAREYDSYASWSSPDDDADLDPEHIPTTRRVRDLDRTSRKKPRFRADRARRGRLTEDERASLAALRDEPEPFPLPHGADRWSTWDSGERGPRPYPEWLVTGTGLDHEQGVLKTGKEADVHLLTRSTVDGGRSCVLAAKRYRDADHRLFHRDAGYLEGRRMRRSRENRAMAQRTSFGRGLIGEQWASAEFRILSTLWSAGAPVPYPVQRVGTEVLLEFIADDDGGAAPRLAALRPDPDLAEDLWRQLVDALALLADEGLTHGDLSAYNVLAEPCGDAAPRLVLIDVPQAVDIVANPLGADYLRRDVSNIASWFESRGVPASRLDVDGACSWLRECAGLH